MMQISYKGAKGALILVDIHIDELLDLYEARCGGTYDYFCVITRVEAERIRTKKSYTDAFNKLDRNRMLFSADAENSANLCLEMLEIAGLSKKGQARFRQHCRGFFPYEFSGNRVVETYGLHLSIDEIQDAAALEEDVLVCTPFVNRMMKLGGGDIRLGILREIQKRKPDYVAHFKFNKST